MNARCEQLKIAMDTAESMAKERWMKNPERHPKDLFIEVLIDSGIMFVNPETLADAAHKANICGKLPDGECASDHQVIGDALYNALVGEYSE